MRRVATRHRKCTPHTPVPDGDQHQVTRPVVRPDTGYFHWPAWHGNADRPNAYLLHRNITYVIFMDARQAT